MILGTPLTPSALRVLLLGSGELGKEITIALQRYGVEVIAADRYAHAPAQHVAQRAAVLDMTDAQALKELVAKEQPHYIVPEIEAIATDALADIEAQGLATVVPNARAVQLTMNRQGIRRLAAEELGLPVSRYAFAENYDALYRAVTEHIGYPCFIKPIMSSSGKGQSRVTAPEQLRAAWDYAETSGRVPGQPVIVESQIDFDYEITLLTVRAKGPNGTTVTHYCEPIGHWQENGDYRESWQPQPMSPRAWQRAQQIAECITGALGGWGLFGVELFVRGDEVWFSEVSPRPHDTGMVTMATQLLNEFELHVRAFLGLPVVTTLRQPGASAAILANVAAPDGVRYAGLPQALAEPGTEIRLFGKPTATPRRRLGVALASAESIQLARQRALAAARCIEISAV